MASPPSRSHSTDGSVEKYDDARIENEKGLNPSRTEAIIDAPNANYAAATTKDTTNARSKEALILYACAAVSFLCSVGNGYDGSLMTGINGMKTFKDTFNDGDKAPTTGLLFSMYTIGQITGSLFASQIADRWGRRAGMFWGCVIIIIGTCVISTSNFQGQFLAGRYILGMGIAVVITAAPTFCIEIAPPQWRGRMTAMYNTGWSGGAIPAAAIVFKTQSMTTNWSWRLPLIIQAVPAALVCTFVWFLPESPRWLYMNGREQEAHAFLTKYHGNNDPNHAIVRLELAEFQNNISLDGADKRWWDFSSLVKTKEARWRSLMVFLMGLFGQMSGNGLGYYQLDVYQSLGFDSYMQFCMNLINACTAAICSWIAVSLSDRMPRRKVLVFGTLMCSVLLASNAGLSAKWASYGKGPKNLNIGKLAAAFFFLFNQMYAFTYTPLQSLYPAECLETTTRAKGVSMKILVISLTSFINLYCIPIGLKNIQWRFMLIFVFWDAFEALVWYLFCVETLGRTLEELEEVFRAPNPVAASKAKKRVAITNDGDAIPIETTRV